MKKKKIVVTILYFLALIAVNVLIWRYQGGLENESITLELGVQTEKPVTVQVFYIRENQKVGKENYNETQVSQLDYNGKGENQKLTFDIPVDSINVRIDPASEENLNVTITNPRITYHGVTIFDKELAWDRIAYSQMAEQMDVEATKVTFITKSDTFVAWNLDESKAIQTVQNANKTKENVKKILICIILDIILLGIWCKLKELSVIPREVWQNRKLVFNLAKNDFKTKFAGSYLGSIWAFVQPIVMVLVYWFVFEKALNPGTQSTKAGITVPFVLWLIAGLVPWFYFSEVLASGTNALIEYNYLVKKVVFKISALPVVKATSSLFVQLFFVAFTIVLYSCYHFYPNWYTLQIVYYLVCMFLLCLGVIYATSAMVVFFKDLSQIINIVLQIGMWMTPIMWNMDAMADTLSKPVEMILKLNPMYYIVSGYRDSLINQVWFWDRPEITLYFWTLVIVLFILGTTIFRRLQPHFADVL